MTTKQKEKNILALINYVEKYPYSLTIKIAAQRYILSHATIYMLIEKLNLEIMGHKMNNDRREIETLLKNGLSVKEVIEEGFNKRLVLGVFNKQSIKQAA